MAPPLTLTREQKEFLQSLLSDLEDCRNLLRAAVEVPPLAAPVAAAEIAVAEAKPKTRSRKKAAAGK